MRRRPGRDAALALSVVAAIAAAGCGSSSSSSAGSAGAPSSVVRHGNAPVTVRFGGAGYLAACEKSMETPNGQGDALSPSQAKAFCGCVQQQAHSRGLGSESEKSVSVSTFRTLFSTCLAQLRGAGTGTGGPATT